MSPARVEAPEPDVWLPILPVTGELEELDLIAELERIELEARRADFQVALRAHEDDFWRSATSALEAVIAEIDLAPGPAVPLPVVRLPAVTPAPEGPVHGPPAPAVAGPVHGPAEPTDSEPAPAGAPAARRHATTSHERRNLIAGTALCIAVLAAFAAVFPSIVGASVPQRDITVTIDGSTFARTVRASTVGDVLAMEDVTLHPQDRVVPPADTALRAGMPIEVQRAFPVDVEVDGSVSTVRTTLRDPVALRRDLGIGAGLIIADAPSRLTAGTTIAFRTPHDVTLQVDGRTIIAPGTGALDVGALLATNKIALGPNDEVTPGPSTRLENGLDVRVFRLAASEVAESVPIPFTTGTRDDPNLPVGQTKVIQAGAAGIRRQLYRVVTRDDGSTAAKIPTTSELLVPPVSQVVVRGTQPIPAQASGSATWYGTGPGPGTCAHLRLRLGTIVTITNTATGAVARCRVADRGPEAWTGHIIDLAPDVFRRLAPLSRGVIPVTLSY